MNKRMRDIREGLSSLRLLNTARATATVEAVASRTASSPSLTSRTIAFLDFGKALPFGKEPLGADFGLRDRVACKFLARWVRNIVSTSISGRDSRRWSVKRIEQTSWSTRWPEIKS